MRGSFNREVYESICDHLFRYSDSRVVGADRITASNFMKHKDENYAIIQRKYETGTYHFTRFQNVQLEKRTVYIPTCRDRVVLEFLCRNLKRRYKVKLKSRKEIVDELMTLFDENVDYYILRLDVKHFFESIDHEKLMQQIKKDALCSVREFDLIRSMLQTYGVVGVPQGVGLSNYLTEIYMKPFDLYMSKISSELIYYSRYVDDILMVFPGRILQKDKEDIDKRIEAIFKKYGLENNKDKYQSRLFSKNICDPIVYLGYSYRKMNQNLTIEIADYKLTEFKLKIDEMFADYFRTKNLELLKERLRFFSAIHVIYKTVYRVNKDNSACYYKRRCVYGVLEDYHYACAESVMKINAYLTYKIKCVRGIGRKDKRDLYSYQLRMQQVNSVVIDENKIPIQTYRSKIYRLQNNHKYAWRDLMAKDKYELIKIYYDIIRG